VAKKQTKGFFEIDRRRVVRLNEVATLIEASGTLDKEYDSVLEKKHAQLEEFQTLMYAGRARAMLIVFQGMDTSGKDGAIKHVMSGVNPQGCAVVSFKTPSQFELDHDFLWRVNVALPVRGMIGIFNRSYYEEALITRVHPELLIAEKLPTGKKHDKRFWEHRYQDILNHENYLHRQGYEIVKIFIHISKEEQKRRLLARFEDAKKHWKISEGDIHERSFWKEYQKAYEECLGRTGSKENPWYIVPGDDKKSARLSIATILCQRFEAMGLSNPELSHKDKRNLSKLKALLKKD